MTTREFQIRGEYITLGQLIKAADLVSSGGEVKDFLCRGEIQVNGEEEIRRGRKLRVGDVVLVNREPATTISIG